MPFRVTDNDRHPSVLMYRHFFTTYTSIEPLYRVGGSMSITPEIGELKDGLRVVRTAMPATQ